VRALTSSEIIQLWEKADHLHPIDQALSILQQVVAEHSRDDLAELPLGQRNGLLLLLRRSTFGDLLPGKSQCPQCGESVEFELSCHSLMQSRVKPQLQCLKQDGFHLEIRPLNSFDLAAAAAEQSTQIARQLLLRRCVAEARLQGESVGLDELPHTLQKRIAETALAADPQSEILLDLQCPSCRHTWQTLLDIGHILWLEISARAHRLLMEVHLLARAYGWGEEQILKLDPARRSSYLQLVTA
jgi:hypothetical protein